jgi:amidase
MMRFTAPFNASGHPTLSLPCGFSDDGMPLSLQLLGALNQDSVLLWVGQVFQSRSQWHCVHPNLDS